MFSICWYNKININVSCLFTKILDNIKYLCQSKYIVLLQDIIFSYPVIHMQYVNIMYFEPWNIFVVLVSKIVSLNFEFCLDKKTYMRFEVDYNNKQFFYINRYPLQSIDWHHKSFITTDYVSINLVSTLDRILLFVPQFYKNLLNVLSYVLDHR